MLSHLPSKMNENLLADRDFIGTKGYASTARLQHAAACSLFIEDSGESIPRHATACSLSNEDCGESIFHSYKACFCSRAVYVSVVLLVCDKF